MSLLVNHVMSQDIPSGIFADIMNYFETLSPDGVRYEVTASPIDGADVYHYHRPHLEKKLQAASVCTVHHDLDETDTWLSLPKFLPRYRESAAVICLNTLQKEKLIAEGLQASRLFVVPHGFNDKILSAKPVRAYDASKKITIGFVSRRYGRRVKGEAYLYELAKRLPVAQFRFLLVGQDRMIDAATLRSFGFEVQCYERLPYRMFNALYAQMDFLLMASQFEGGPANIPEAVATGTPCLTNPIGMARDAVSHGYNGMYLTMDPAVDAELFWDLALNTKGLTDQLYQGAAAAVSSALTWKQSIEGNLAVYAKVAAAHPVASA